jgi:hypothetical protein
LDRAQTIALLNTVPVWFEIWRTLNGFPPDYYEMNEKAEKLKKKNNEIFYFILLLFGLNLQAQNRVKRYTSKTRIYIQRIFGLCQKISSAG